jgi:hypothetical protein
MKAERLWGLRVFEYLNIWRLKEFPLVVSDMQVEYNLYHRQANKPRKQNLNQMVKDEAICGVE